MIGSSYYSVPQIAEKLAIKPDKVLTWLRTGELRGVNLATRTGGRPRWRISAEDLENFLDTRSTGQTSSTTKKRRSARRDESIIEFF